MIAESEIFVRIPSGSGQETIPGIVASAMAGLVETEDSFHQADYGLVLTPRPEGGITNY